MGNDEKACARVKFQVKQKGATFSAELDAWQADPEGKEEAEAAIKDFKEGK